ncbi:MAG TPA: hypothetical protein VF405_11305 [Gammaproteobacteria bacterium]
MRRATFVLASVVAAAVVAALLYGRDSLPPTTAAYPDQTEAVPPPTAAEPNELDTASDEEAVAQNRQAPSSNINDEIRRQRMPQLDEATQREQNRKLALNEVVIGYWLLLEDLALPKQDALDLIALLADMQTEQMWTGYQRGRTIGEEERWERISAIIGTEKTELFLTLEQHGREYWETYQIALLMQRRGVPTTEAQRDAVFDMLVDVHERYPSTRTAELDTHSEEWIDEVLRQLDDTDRHVVEMAPSVLSPTQVAYLSRAYDHMSRERLDDLEWQKKMKIDHPNQDRGWVYPGRWGWRSFQP